MRELLRKYWRYFKYGDIISPADKIPPAKNDQDHAQKTENRGYWSTGDTFISRDRCTTLVEKHTTVIQQQQTAA